MAQISGTSNQYCIYRVSLKNEFQSKEKEEIDLLLGTLSKEQLTTFWDPKSKGFVAYPIEPSTVIENSVKFKNSFIDDVLVLKYIEYQAKGKRNSTKVDHIRDLLENSNLEQALRSDFESLLKDQLIKPIYQDFIFIHDNSFILVFPTKDESRTLENQLAPFISEFFEISQDITIKNISSDVLEWIFFKIIRQKNGVLDNFVITHSDGLTTPIMQNTGKMDLNGIENVHNVTVAKIQIGCYNQPLQRLRITIEYNKKEYKFDLFTGGRFTPEWTNLSTYQTGNPRSNKILAIRDIAKFIIPQLYREYFRDFPNWDKERVDLKNQLTLEAKENL